MNEKECVACGQCIDSCPHGAIKVRQSKGYSGIELDAMSCKRCGACDGICPMEN